MNNSIFVSILKTANLLCVSRSTVYRLAKDGRITLIKIGRRTVIARAELERLATELASAPLPRV